MSTKRTLGEMVFEVINTGFLLFLAIVTLYPFLYVAFASVSDPASMVKHTGLLLKPLGFDTSAYVMVFKNPMILRGYQNTLLYVLLGTVLNLLMTSLGAYVLSRKNVLLRDTIMVMIAFTMFFSGGMIPSYLLVKSLGIFNTVWALLIPTAISTYNLIIMRTSFMGIPDSMEESARIDGANDFVILFRIILPLSKAVISVMILYYGVGHWNAWFNAMMYLRIREMYPLQLILREILISSSTDNMMTAVGGSDKEPVGEIVKYATIMVATVPVLMVYPFLQKYFTKGVMIGAIKG